MLVLARKVGETVIIGRNVKVKIVEARGSGRVTLAIDAPRDVAIDRYESLDGKEVACHGGPLLRF